MKIIFSTDKSIDLSTTMKERYTVLIKTELAIFDPIIVALEIYLKQEDPKRDGNNNKYCVLETKILGRNPLTIINRSHSNIQAIKGATNRMKNSLDILVA